MSIRIPQDYPYLARNLAALEGDGPSDAAALADEAEFINRQAWQAELALDAMLEDHLAASLAGTSLADTPLMGTPLTGRDSMAAMERAHDAQLALAPTPAARDGLDAALSTVRQRATRQFAASDQVHRLHARVDDAEQGLATLADLAQRRPEQAGMSLTAGLGLLGRMGRAGTRAHGLAERTRAFRAQIAAAALDGLARQDPDNALSRFDNGDLDDLWEDSTLRANGRSALERSLTALAEDKERAQLQAAPDSAKRRFAFRAGFEERLQAGQASHGELAGGIEDGLLSEAEAAGLAGRMDAQEEAEELRDSRAQRINQAMERGETLDGSDPQTLAAVDAHYQAITAPHLATLEADEGARLADHMARRAGLAPAGLVKQLRGDLLSGDPARGLGAAKRMAFLMVDPALAASLTSRMPAHELSRALAIAEFADPEMDLAAERAVQLGEEALRRERDDPGHRRAAKRRAALCHAHASRL